MPAKPAKEPKQPKKASKEAGKKKDSSRDQLQTRKLSGKGRSRGEAEEDENGDDERQRKKKRAKSSSPGGSCVPASNHAAVGGRLALVACCMRAGRACAAMHTCSRCEPACDSPPAMQHRNSQLRSHAAQLPPALASGIRRHANMVCAPMQTRVQAPPR